MRQEKPICLPEDHHGHWCLSVMGTFSAVSFSGGFPAASILYPIAPISSFSPYIATTATPAEPRSATSGG
jgi:hypothetical protein